MPWNRNIIEAFLNRYPVLRAIGNTPLVPVSMFGDDLPGVEVLAKMECLNRNASTERKTATRITGAPTMRRRR